MACGTGNAVRTESSVEKQPMPEAGGTLVIR
jgi:hypothetical protein